MRIFKGMMKWLRVIPVRRRALTNAERQARYRERKKLEDPEFLKREAVRQKALRKRRKG